MQAQFAAHRADRPHFVGAVNGTDFRGLSQGHHAWLGVMDVLAFEGDLADRLGRQFAVFGLGQQQLGAVGEELRRAAFVGFDVGGLRADHAVVALAQRRQGQ